MNNLSFQTAPCYQIRVQTPEAHVDRLLASLSNIDPLLWGDYDQVSFTTTPGQQRFRALASARNAATSGVEIVPCVELSFVVAASVDLTAVLAALCDTHAYEEPVIVVTQALRTLHIRGMGDENPNRFWNLPSEDWIPEVHR